MAGTATQAWADALTPDEERAEEMAVANAAARTSLAARRRFVLRLAALSAGMAPLAAVSQLPVQRQAPLPTPRQTEGPFYPLSLPADADNDLVSVRGAPGLAKGEVTHLSGRILDANGRPLGGVRVEIWQCDANGRYHHPRDRSGGDRDTNFQGFGHDVSAVDGSYSFRTIRPVPYPGRTPTFISNCAHGRSPNSSRRCTSRVTRAMIVMACWPACRLARAGPV